MSCQTAVIDPETDARWNAFVERHPFGSIYHLSGWKRALETNFPHMKGHYLVLLDGAGDCIRAALPMFEVRSWLTGKRLVSIPFASLCDPLIASEADFAVLFESALSLASQLGITKVEIRTYKTLPLVQDGRLRRGGLYKLHYLSLEQGADELWKHFHRSCVRQKISRAITNALTLKTVETRTDLKAFYKLYVMTRQRLCLPPQPLAFLESIWDALSPSNQISVLLALKDGLPISGLLLFKFQGRVSAEYGVSDQAYWGLNPNHFLFWEAIQSACKEGYTVFDFGRTSPDNRELLEFKERWGTREEELVEFHYPREGTPPMAIREKTVSYRAVRRLLNYVPEAMFERLGGYCYRHLG